MIIKVDSDIAALDLECVAYKACRDEGWSLKQVDIAELEYRAFLHVIRHCASAAIAPSKRVDLFWHHHILDTAKYIQDCEALFGRYIHHFPYSGLFGDADAKAQRERVLNTMHRVRELLT
jgi:hypothetical protein